jgi:hypothetical protein
MSGDMSRQTFQIAYDGDTEPIPWMCRSWLPRYWRCHFRRSGCSLEFPLNTGVRSLRQLNTSKIASGF